MSLEPSSRELLTIEEYVTLSAKINYQLSAHSLNTPILLALVLGPATMSEADRDILLQAFEVLRAGYEGDRRRLGTPGILHPLRTAALLTRTMAEPTVMHLIGALLHDKDEDLTKDGVGTEKWERMQGKYESLLEMLGADRASVIQERVTALSRCGEDTYEQYLSRILDHARAHPELLHVKLADRIDNTFDIHLQHPGVTKYNFYRAVFDILFLPKFSGVEMGSFHFMPEAREGVMLLSQLFKGLIFLALLRHERLDKLDETTRRLFIGLAVAGIREAQWLALEIFNTCVTDVERQRELLKDVMDYSTKGGMEAVTRSEQGGELDGVLLKIFTAQKDGTRTQMLTDLFQDRERLARMVLAFIVVFAAFINDPEYTVQGIDRSGARAQ